ncbi:MAG TPA: hypothetical protein VF701_14770 [Thermoanaerobaculia bacterium]
MPKLLFYVGTAFCLFLALTSVGEAVSEVRGGAISFAALPQSAHAPSAILVALLGGLAVATLFLRMAALLAARNLFAAFVAVLAVSGAMAALTGVLLVQWRMTGASAASIGELHSAGLMAFGFFLSLSMLSLRPYFSIQASRFLSALVFFPLPLFGLVLAQEMFISASPAPIPFATPASSVYFSVLAVLFFSIALHCIRHRHLFLEMTNLRELLDARVDPAGSGGRPIGGVAYDS